jgi:hypothetical protein
MTFALATLAFLFAAWLAIVVLAGTIEDYGAKVRAALSGRAPSPVAAVGIRLRPRYDARRPLTPRARPRLRAAA